MKTMTYPEARQHTGTANLLRAYPGPSRLRVLFAMPASEAPAAALWRAHKLAQAFGAELFVLGILPISSPNSPVHPQLLATLRAINTGKEALRFTRVFCERSLPVGIDHDNIFVKQGALLPAVVSAVKEYNIDLLVLPSEQGKDGKMVTKLARLAQIPVLVARSPGLTETIVAASDLEDQECPILKRANQLSQTSGAPMVLVHNLHPVVGIETDLPTAEELRSRQQRLRYNTKKLAPDAETVLLSAPNTVEAILRVAQQKCADLIVVGAYRRSWLNRIISSGTAAQIAEKAERSVLVTPLS